MTITELVEMVRDLQDAGEMHGMDIDDAVDFIGNAYQVPDSIRDAATEILYNA